MKIEIDFSALTVAPGTTGKQYTVLPAVDVEIIDGKIVSVTCDIHVHYESDGKGGLEWHTSHPKSYRLANVG